MIHGGSAADTHADLAEAVRAGLVLRSGETYEFLHDRVQEAAYSRIPEEQRAAQHLGIGRLLSSRLPAEVIAERVFDVANQWTLGPGSSRITREGVALQAQPPRRDEGEGEGRVRVGEELPGPATTLLPGDAWSARYEETFALHLELSECEYFGGDFRRAGELSDLTLENARSTSTAPGSTGCA